MAAVAPDAAAVVLSTYDPVTTRCYLCHMHMQGGKVVCVMMHDGRQEGLVLVHPECTERLMEELRRPRPASPEEISSAAASITWAEGMRPELGTSDATRLMAAKFGRKGVHDVKIYAPYYETFWTTPAVYTAGRAGVKWGPELAQEVLGYMVVLLSNTGQARGRDKKYFHRDLVNTVDAVLHAQTEIDSAIKFSAWAELHSDLEDQEQLLGVFMISGTLGMPLDETKEAEAIAEVKAYIPRRLPAAQRALGYALGRSRVEVSVHYRNALRHVDGGMEVNCRDFDPQAVRDNFLFTHSSSSPYSVLRVAVVTPPGGNRQYYLPTTTLAPQVPSTLETKLPFDFNSDRGGLLRFVRQGIYPQWREAEEWRLEFASTSAEFGQARPWVASPEVE